MVTTLRETGARFVIFMDDHAPAHVHVVGDGVAKINLAGPDGQLELVSTDGLKAGDLRKAMRIVAERQAALLAHWKDHHG